MTRGHVSGTDPAHRARMETQAWTDDTQRRRAPGRGRRGAASVTPGKVPPAHILTGRRGRRCRRDSVELGPKTSTYDTNPGSNITDSFITKYYYSTLNQFKTIPIKNHKQNL